MADLDDSWFESAARPSCDPHGRGAESVCSRCGAFQCELCTPPTASSYCQPCAVLMATEALPGLSTRAAWKLVFLPLIGVACLATLAAKGAPLRSLTGEHPGFLAAWLVPFACGLGLAVRPVAPLAFVGSLVALALVAVALGPPLVADFSGQRVLDLVVLGAAPMVALRDAFAIDRAHRHQALLAAMATA
ncbi:MAG: hypothetical protein IAE78_04505 [Myxococcus sp.]|nr:hypothetical protein [Myxococcus sp.]